MFDRFLSACLFCAAAALFWFIFWLLTRDTFFLPWLGGASTLAALLVGAFAGPLLAAGAAQPGGPRRGCVSGAWVTLAAFVLGALLFPLLPYFTEDAFRGTTALVAAKDILSMFTLSIIFGFVFLIPALPFGMGAGWLFYKLRSSALSGAA